MSEVKKIKEEELKLIIEQQTQLNNLNQEIGFLEQNKFIKIDEIKALNISVSEFKEVLEAEYGAININLEDGSYTFIEKEVEKIDDVEEDKKD
jgi:hypothetical protein|tara:strand:- start:287 stop:565 length:279 start_codon:yes stop_codon:yes gene_type:complete